MFNWNRGLFRLWLVASAVWILCTLWYAYGHSPQNYELEAPDGRKFKIAARNYDQVVKFVNQCFPASKTSKPNEERDKENFWWEQSPIVCPHDEQLTSLWSIEIHGVNFWAFNVLGPPITCGIGLFLLLWIIAGFIRRPPVGGASGRER